MKIFLHIGMPKTGSSTIQRALKCSKRELRRDRVYYRRTDFFYDLVGASKPDWDFKVHSDNEKLIISDERLFNQVRSPVDAKLIADALRALSPDINLVSYVRREDEVFVSAYFTRLLMGGSERFIDLPLVPVQTYKRLKSWRSPFSSGNIILRRFGSPYLANGLLADFAETVGIQEGTLKQEPPRNSSPRCDVLETIRLLNETRGRRRFDHQLLKKVARSVGFGEPIGMSAEKRRRLIEQAREGDRRLSTHFFNGEPVFTHAVLDDEPRWPNITIDDLVRIGERIAEIYGISAGNAPDNVEAGLEWIREIAARCPAHQVLPPGTNHAASSG